MYARLCMHVTGVGFVKPLLTFTPFFVTSAWEMGISESHVALTTTPMFTEAPGTTQ